MNDVKYKRGLELYFQSKLYSYFQHDLNSFNEIDLMLKTIIRQTDLTFKPVDVYSLYNELYNTDKWQDYNAFKLAECLKILTLKETKQ
ncbi:hypothetical protein DS891_07070 [Pseudoalteromonas sp. JC28]|nr:hypothetical protein [Pseudoalteromonas sp. JC28]